VNHPFPIISTTEIIGFVQITICFSCNGYMLLILANEVARVQKHEVRHITFTTLRYLIVSFYYRQRVLRATESVHEGFDASVAVGSGLALAFMAHLR